MRKGFTILELLVASLLLGMLVTVLTMIFNQSSIAWRTGVAGVADLDEVRENIAGLREEADNVYVWDKQVYRIISPWKEDGSLRNRAITFGGEGSDSDANKAQILKGRLGGKELELDDLTIVPVGNGDAGTSVDTYIVNVKSDGPDGQPDTYDDIWSFPDDFE